MGTYAIKPPLPHTPGSATAGTIESVGTGVTGSYLNATILHREVRVASSRLLLPNCHCQSVLPFDPDDRAHEHPLGESAGSSSLTGVASFGLRGLRHRTSGLSIPP
jgi:NADPH:quinone reductase-like Zn-dependent oxidoreductase